MDSIYEKYWVSRQWKLAIVYFIIGSLGCAVVVDNAYVQIITILCGVYFVGLYIFQVKQPLISIEENELTIRHLPNRKKIFNLANISILEENYFLLKGITLKNGLGQKVVLPTKMLSKEEHRKLVTTLNNYT